MRRLWAIGTILSLIGLAFWAGYISYPLIQGTVPPVAAAPDGLTPLAPAASPQRTDTQISTYWEAWDILERDFYGTRPDPTARTYGAIRGLTEIFDDPYTYFLEPQPRQLERDELRGRFGGIGATVERTEAGYILHPLPDQPAARAGMQAGDRLIQVDGEEVMAHMDSEAVVARVRGPVGSVVTLVVLRVDATEADPGHADSNHEANQAAGNPALNLRELTFEIERAEIQTPSVEWQLLAQCHDLPERDDEPTDQAEFCTDPTAPRMGYIRHTLFSERSPAEMEAAVTELTDQGATHFVLDMRGNPGGLVNSAVAVADLWLDGGPIYIEQKADGTENVTTAQPGELAEDYPLVVIVDGGSASASEIVAGALQDHRRAHVIGEQTFGKGSVQLIYELSDQSSIHVTNAEWFTPNRRRISPDGLTPDLVIEPGSDPVRQAIAWLSRAD